MHLSIKKIMMTLKICEKPKPSELCKFKKPFLHATIYHVLMVYDASAIFITSARVCDKYKICFERLTSEDKLMVESQSFAIYFSAEIDSSCGMSGHRGQLH